MNTTTPEPLSFREGVIIIIALSIGTWLFLTLLYWLMEQSAWNKPTFLDVIKSQWEFIKNLKLW